MKPVILLRLAAVIMLLHTLSHLLATLTWRQAPDKVTAATISSMNNHHFELFGRQASMGEFYEGHMVAMTLVLTSLTALLWLFSNNTENPLTQKLLFWVSMFLLVNSVIEWYYILFIPALMNLAAALLTLIYLPENTPGGSHLTVQFLPKSSGFNVFRLHEKVKSLKS